MRIRLLTGACHEYDQLTVACNEYDQLTVASNEYDQLTVACNEYDQLTVACNEYDQLTVACNEYDQYNLSEGRIVSACFIIFGVNFSASLSASISIITINEIVLYREILFPCSESDYHRAMLLTICNCIYIYLYSICF